MQTHKLLQWHKMISELKYGSKNFYARQIISLVLQILGANSSNIVG